MKMASFVSTFIAVFVLLPFLAYIISFIFIKEILKSHKRAVQISADITTFLLMISVHFIILAIWEQSYLWLLFIIVFLIGVIIALVHWKIRGEVDFGRVFKGFWRLNFIVFSTAYISLIFIGLIVRIVHMI